MEDSDPQGPRMIIYILATPNIRATVGGETTETQYLLGDT